MTKYSDKLLCSICVEYFLPHLTIFWKTIFLFLIFGFFPPWKIRRFFLVHCTIFIPFKIGMLKFVSCSFQICPFLTFWMIKTKGQLLFHKLSIFLKSCLWCLHNRNIWNSGEMYLRRFAIQRGRTDGRVIFSWSSTARQTKAGEFDQWSLDHLAKCIAQAAVSWKRLITLAGATTRIWKFIHSWSLAKGRSKCKILWVPHSYSFIIPWKKFILAQLPLYLQLPGDCEIYQLFIGQNKDSKNGSNKCSWLFICHATSHSGSVAGVETMQSWNHVRACLGAESCSACRPRLWYQANIR